MDDGHVDDGQASKEEEGAKGTKAWDVKSRSIEMATGSSKKYTREDPAGATLSEDDSVRSVYVQDLPVQEDLPVPGFTAAEQIVSDLRHSQKRLYRHSIHEPPAKAVVRRRRHRRSFKIPSGTRQPSAG